LTVITRRKLMRALATGFGASAVGIPAQSSSTSKRVFSIVDTHGHIWILNDPKYPVKPSGRGQLPDYSYTAEALIADMATHGISHAVMSQARYHGKDNSYLIDSIRKYPDKIAGQGLLIGLGLYSPEDPENPARLETLMKEGRLSGLRLSPIYEPQQTWLNSRETFPLWRKAEALRAIFNVFIAPHQLLQLGEMAARFPGVRIVIDHFGMIDIDEPGRKGFETLLSFEKYSNVYCKVHLNDPSKSKEIPFRDMFPFLQRLYERYGPRRLMYAHLCELLIIKEIVPFFTSEDRDWILGRTALTLWKFPRRTRAEMELLPEKWDTLRMCRSNDVGSRPTGETKFRVGPPVIGEALRRFR